jgi:hypothetical protein
MAQHQVLFCPFCRESFEAVDTCPEHDLALVSFDKLPRDDDEDDDEAPLSDEAPLRPLDPRFGRASVAAGALLNALGLVLPLVRFPDGTTLSTSLLASSLPGLWSLGLVSFTLLFVLRRGNTLRKLRALRVLVPALACVGPALLVWELSRIRAGAVLWAAHVRSSHAAPSTAFYAVCVASLLIGYGGLRLGVVPPRARD